MQVSQTPSLPAVGSSFKIKEEFFRDLYLSVAKLPSHFLRCRGEKYFVQRVSEEGTICCSCENSMAPSVNFHGVEDLHTMVDWINLIIKRKVSLKPKVVNAIS